MKEAIEALGTYCVTVLPVGYNCYNWSRSVTATNPLGGRRVSFAMRARKPRAGRRVSDFAVLVAQLYPTPPLIEIQYSSLPKVPLGPTSTQTHLVCQVGVVVTV